ncbi:hypothetical protein Y1Q_0004632 [Alligator mississippiensis]|uniref:Uncharacterized protein n=1 Tax=Alligator mississippiensis TaxID=8496 RepID=A0A151MHT4_ALLMI|nr:hypothetical protein Y1Q_0004632 [Alligator mississippiensis]
MDTAQPASKNMGEVALVANNTLQDNGEVVLVVNEHLGTLGQAENEDIVSVTDKLLIQKFPCITEYTKHGYNGICLLKDPLMKADYFQGPVTSEASSIHGENYIVQSVLTEYTESDG